MTTSSSLSPFTLHSNKVPQEVHFKDLLLAMFPEDKLLTVKEE